MPTKEQVELSRIKREMQELEVQVSLLTVAIAAKSEPVTIAGVAEPTRFADDTIRFAMSNGERHYNYAAIRVGNRWYTTGSTCPKNGYSWLELRNWGRSQGRMITHLVVMIKPDLPF